MANKHGVYVSEVATSILPPVEATAGIPFIVGTAPVNMTDETNVNKPVLCHSYAEAVEAFGYVPPVEDPKTGLKKFEFSICEFIHSQFALFGTAPVIIVNVLNCQGTHSSTKQIEYTLDTKTGSATIPQTGIRFGVDNDGVPCLDMSLGTMGEDYIASFDDNGYVVITSLKDENGSFRCPVGEKRTTTVVYCDPSRVTEEDIIGGVDTAGNKSGLELIDECFPRFRLVPGLILAPGYSSDASVAAVMAAKAANINEHFTALALIDVPTDTVKSYNEVAAWKNNNNVVDPKQVVCFPMLSLDGVVYHQSTQLAGLIGKTDADNDDVPCVSPSNKNYQMTAAVLADGTEVWLSPETAAYLNGQGVVTALNFIGGWKCWGNRTACYPGNSDVKDSMIAVRRMFSWTGNTLVQTFWQRVDLPLVRRQVDAIVDSANIWLNGLTARQFILGGRVEFLDTENPTTDLMDGVSRFHVYFTPPSPNREIDFILEYDPSYLETLFG